MSAFGTRRAKSSNDALCTFLGGFDGDALLYDLPALLFAG